MYVGSLDAQSDNIKKTYFANTGSRYKAGECCKYTYFRGEEHTCVFETLNDTISVTPIPNGLQILVVNEWDLLALFIVRVLKGRFIGESVIRK